MTARPVCAPDTHLKQNMTVIGCEVHSDTSATATVAVPPLEDVIFKGSFTRGAPPLLDTIHIQAMGSRRCGECQ
jgi:hypothetical protein